jgi:hypothetical protein
MFGAKNVADAAAVGVILVLVFLQCMTVAPSSMVQPGMTVVSAPFLCMSSYLFCNIFKLRILALHIHMYAL